jgi:hypothetical protein
MQGRRCLGCLKDTLALQNHESLFSQYPTMLCSEYGQKLYGTDTDDYSYVSDTDSSEGSSDLTADGCSSPLAVLSASDMAWHHLLWQLWTMGNTKLP